LGFTR